MNHVSGRGSVSGRGLIKRAVQMCGYDVIRFDPVRYESFDEHRVTEGKIVPCVIDGVNVSFFVADDEDIIQREHLRRRFYEREELEIIKRYFPGGVFLDVGANVGNHTLYAAMFLGAAQVIAVEPNPAARRILRLNVALNDLSGKVTIYGVGLSDACAQASIRVPRHNLGGAVLSAGAGSIELVRGDDLVRGTKIGFIKIDAEGMELGVLKGLSGVIENGRPPLFVEVEDTNADAFSQLVRTFGYSVRERYRRYNSNENLLLVPA